MPSRLGILAGGGDLPKRLVAACRRIGRPVFVVAFTGQTDDDTTEDVDHCWARLGGVRRTLDRLHAEGVSQLCLAGRFRRPSLRELMPDPWTAKLLLRVDLSRLGDDALHAVIRDGLEREGFQLVGPHDILSDLLVRPGTLTRISPDSLAWQDIERGRQVARTLGALDVGQGVVVQQGIVLAVEAAEGTDAMLGRCAALRREGPGGVLVKVKKPQQDMQIDLPTIGPATVEGAAAAGLRGVAVEAGAAYVVDAAAMAGAAEARGLFVVGFESPP